MFFRSVSVSPFGRAVIDDVSARHADDARRKAPRELDIVNVDDDGDARSRATRCRISMISTDVLGSSEEVGSSARMISGSCMMARAMPTRWRWPPGQRVGALGCAKPGKPDRIEQVESALDVALGKFAQPGAPHRNIAEPAAQQVLHDASGARRDCTPGTPCRCGAARSSGRGRTSFARSWPRNRISPDVGCTRRLTQRISVLLPVPEGPMMAVRPEPGKVRSMPRSTG